MSQVRNDPFAMQNNRVCKSNQMTPKEEKAFRVRMEILEAQQTVMTGFIAILLQTELNHLPEPQRSRMQTTYANLFEKTIARLLASEVGFKDATIRAIERMKVSMLEVSIFDQT